jgi:O-6-methylguanine DNA methyltransferase
MTLPSERLTLARVPSPVGPLHVASDAAGRLHAVDFDEYEARMRRLLRRHYGAGGWTAAAGPAPQPVREALEAYFAGEIAALDGLAVETGGTTLQRAVWAALRGVPPGTTTSYGALAATLGRPDACRAVGAANGANPVVLVVPCHRVIGRDGTLTGYGGGLARKRWLLAHEARWAGAAPRAAAGSRA